MNEKMIRRFQLLISMVKQTFLVTQMVKNLPAVQETQVWSLSWEDPLEKGMATHSSILVWKIPWTEEAGRPQSMGSQRVVHDATNNFTFHFRHINIFCYNVRIWNLKIITSKSSLIKIHVYLRVYMAFIFYALGFFFPE